MSPRTGIFALLCYRFIHFLSLCDCLRASKKGRRHLIMLLSLLRVFINRPKIVIEKFQGFSFFILISMVHLILNAKWLGARIFAFWVAFYITFRVRYGCYESLYPCTLCISFCVKVIVFRDWWTIKQAWSHDKYHMCVKAVVFMYLWRDPTLKFLSLPLSWLPIHSNDFDMYVESYNCSLFHSTSLSV